MNDREQYVCADDVSNCYSVLEKHNSHKSHVKVFFSSMSVLMTFQMTIVREAQSTQVTCESFSPVWVC